MRQPAPPRAPEPAGEASRPAAIDTVEMWENLCRADELSEECEALARGRETATGTMPAPSDESASG